MDYSSVLSRLCPSVLATYQHQVMDENDVEYGAFYVGQFYGFGSADHTNSGNALARACYVYLLEGSELYGDKALLTRIKAGLRFVKSVQRETGLIDLPKVDFDSPPDTAFMVQLLCPIYELAQRIQAEGGDLGASAGEIMAGLKAFLVPAGAGLVDRGFRTPNHRWVVSSALAQAMALFPEIDGMAYLETILAETADINADGEWSERSTGIYSAVCNRAWRLIADKLNRPEYLEHVRRDLDFMATLLNPDGTVVTSISYRQDGNTKQVPITMVDSFYEMGMRDNNSKYLAISDALFKATDDCPVWLVHGYAQHPEWIGENQPREALPDSIDVFYEHSKFWRINDYYMAATVTANNPTVFGIKVGEVSLNSMRIQGTFFNQTKFEADHIEKTATGVKLVHNHEKFEKPGWDLPLNRPVEFENPHKGYYQLINGPRERWHIKPISVGLNVARVDGGFDFNLHTIGGYDRIPFIVEWFFSAGTSIQTGDIITKPRAGDSIQLRSGKLAVHDGKHAIEIGPGSEQHRMTDMLATQPVAGCYRVFMAFLSPVDADFSVRYGLWSQAKQAIV